jgi:hypothetical protein
VGTRRRFVLLFGAASSAVALVLAACVGDQPSLPLSTPDGAAPTADTGTPASDAADSAPPCTCASANSLACSGSTTDCVFGCSTDGGAHCAVIHPAGGGLSPDFLLRKDVDDIVIAENKRFDTETGAIGVDSLQRQANKDPLSFEVKDGIGFQIVSLDASHKIAVWVARNITVNDGHQITFRSSSNAAALVATEDIDLAGVIDVRGRQTNGEVCGDEGGSRIGIAGPGGGSGGNDVTPAGGPGAGHAAPNQQGGASGGGYGATGGNGGGGSTAGGAAYGDQALSLLLGGSGGGGAAPLGGSYNGVGGGGGGAIQLLAMRSIVIHGTGGINAGGCGGKRGGDGDGGVGGAGGSGGAILIEAPTFELRDTAVLAVNGGSGASNTQDGENGTLNAEPPETPTPTLAGCGRAGNGGAGLTYAGGNGTAASPASTCGGGAGGGSVGRIRIHNRTGEFTVPGSAIISPTLGAPGSTSTVGTLDVR